MTIKLLAYWNGFDANTIITETPENEAGLIAAGMATADTAGGVYRFRPVGAPGAVSVGAQPIKVALDSHEETTLTVPVGYRVTATGAAGAQGAADLVEGLSAVRSWPIGAGPNAIGPFLTEQRVRIASGLGAFSVVAEPRQRRGASRTQMILGDSISARGCHLPHTPEDRATQTNFGPWNTLNANGQFISSLEVQFGTPAGATAKLRYEAVTGKLYWTAPGDTEGPGVVISPAACLYTLESGTPNRRIYLGMIPSKKPSADATDTFTITTVGAMRKSNVGSIGILPIANALMGCPYQQSYAFGIGGIAASDWLAASAQWENVYTDDTDIILGTNGISFRSAMLTEIAAVEEIIKKRLAIGSRVTFSGLFPANARTTLQRQVAAEMGYLMRQIADKYNIALVDGFSMLADPTTGNFVAGYSADGLHPSNLAAFRVAQMWVAAKGSPAAARNSLQQSLPLFSAVDAPYGNLIPNGALTGTTGSLGARATGTVPTGWIVESTGGSGVLKTTCTAPASAGATPRFNGAPGNAFTIDFDNTGGANNENVVMRLNAFIPPANYAEGESIQYELEIAISGTGIICVSAQANTPSQSNYALFPDTAATSALGSLDGKQMILPLRSMPMVLEPGATNLTVDIRVSCLAGAIGKLLVDPTVCLHKVMPR